MNGRKYFKSRCDDTLESEWKDFMESFKESIDDIVPTASSKVS